MIVSKGCEKLISKVKKLDAEFKKYHIVHHEIIDGKFREYGLGCGQPPILKYLSDNEDATQKEIADYFNISQPAVAKSLKKMEESGLIIRFENKNDSRCHKLKLTKKGSSYFGLCPFHDDHNPSMSISSEKQIYKCFVCGASGNVFNFVMDYEHISFPETLNLLAKRYNMEGDFNLKKEVSKYEPYYEIMNIASKFYKNDAYPYEEVSKIASTNFFTLVLFIALLNTSEII